MSPRALTLLVSGFLVLALGVVGAFLKVPYVVLSPGPTENTLGEVSKKPVIAISGRQTYPTSGALRLTTVEYKGGPTNRIDLMTALRGWIDPAVAVVPEATIFPPDQTAQQVEEQNAVEMTNSQDNATAAALTELKIPFTMAVTVVSTEKGMPAHGVLQKGDEIVSIDGKPLGGVDEAVAAVKAHKPGDTIVLGILRNGSRQEVSVKAAASPQNAARLGVSMQAKYKFPFEVRINVGEVGGPSAGLMFSLGILDKLTPGELTGGKSIAGTGTITPEGEVGPIGGIAQKMVGARKAGASVFLTPEDNCAEAVKAAPDGLRLVKASTLHQVVQALDALRTGRGTVPSCAAG
ncbi:PDZ domain-containing protein [Thermoactinospora rubra]|uniref:YlbL family protein n=1 Tax=Thermoactinospora rubra TaxID=1088767 RepID=UPI000A122BD2|nr:PDZ domain-containing protein [Thermoactinospora rubra]